MTHGPNLTPAPSTSRDPQEAISTRIASNPAEHNMKGILEGLPLREYWVKTEAFHHHVHAFGWAFLDTKAIEAVHAHTAPHGHKVLSLFTGLGYAEAQMVARGMDVVGFDREVHKDRWLLDTHEGPGETDFSRFADRALFLSFPDPTKESIGGSAPVAFIERFLAAGGSSVITINEERPRFHPIQCDQELLDLLARRTCKEVVPLPAWPTVECFALMRGPGDFRPVLKVHQFA
jgi:hypothetical protein